MTGPHQGLAGWPAGLVPRPRRVEGHDRGMPEATLAKLLHPALVRRLRTYVIAQFLNVSDRW